jgi:hypothetical protein
MITVRGTLAAVFVPWPAEPPTASLDIDPVRRDCVLKAFSDTAVQGSAPELPDGEESDPALGLRDLDDEVGRAGSPQGADVGLTKPGSEHVPTRVPMAAEHLGKGS